MDLLINTIILWMISLFMALAGSPSYLGVVALLLTIIVAAISVLYPSLRLSKGLRIGYLFISFVSMDFFLYVPVLFHFPYQSIKNKKYTLLLLIYLLPLLFHFNELNAYYIAAWLFEMLLAGLLKKRLIEQTQLEEDYKRQRDASKELALLLSEKNNDLLLAQEQEIQIATLNERNRIAREIHDNVGHLLSSALLQVGALQAISQEEALKQPLQDLRSTVSTGMDAIRSSVHDLHEDALDLGTAIQKLADHFTFCDITNTYDVLHNPNQDTTYHLLAIIKECMNNTMKHSNATQMFITMREQPSFYQLIIRDNGTLKTTNKNGIGLKNMEERIASMHGYLNIQKEQGFRIFITIPKEDTL